VREKAEIVTMGQPDIDPLAAGSYVTPQDWNAFITAPGTIVIDTRNDYEVAVGSFAGAIDPETPSFRDFPAWFRANRDSFGPSPRVAMFCTGGIRCEKSTAFLKAEGIEDVHHLQGGILKYLETVSAAESLGHGLVPGSHGLCRACRRPVSAEDRASPLFEEGIRCPACHGLRDETQRAGYRERHRQTRLAEARGQLHVGAVLPKPGD
jgi:UPF0176 protein